MIFILLAAEEIQELWQEYENNSSLEANLVKDFDKACNSAFYATLRTSFKP